MNRLASTSLFAEGEVMYLLDATTVPPTRPTALEAFKMHKNQKVRNPLSPGTTPVPPKVSSIVPILFACAHRVMWKARG
jgi:hypothetical protein